MKILLLTTGGTIACQPSEHGLAPAKDGFLREFAYTGEHDICVKEIFNIDSTNMTPKRWGVIAENIKKGLLDDANYDGIVVTHGTDTMAYTLAAMPYYLGNVNKPVIFTGSQIPMGEPDSDAKKNLTDAISTAASGRCGIYLVFAGKIIDGRYAKKVYAKQKKAFESINMPDAGRIAEDGLPIFTTDYAEIKNNVKKAVKPNSLVACIKLLPGQNTDMMDFLIEKGYHGVILEAFGCGGISDDWVMAIKRAVKAGVIVYVQSQCTYDGTDLSVYEVGQKAREAGALCADDMTTEALCVKLMLEC